VKDVKPQGQDEDKVQKNNESGAVLLRKQFNSFSGLWLTSFIRSNTTAVNLRFGVLYFKTSTFPYLHPVRGDHPFTFHLPVCNIDNNILSHISASIHIVNCPHHHIINIV
jgi:hypothetical protein